LEVGPATARGPRVGLASPFLIQIEEGTFERNPLRLAGDAGDGGAMERRPLERTRVHSLAVITCSTNVVGAITGTLTPCQLVGRVDDGELAEAGSGDATSHDVQSRTRSHRRDEIASARCLRHFREASFSADELRLRVGEGMTGDRERGSVPLGSPEGGDRRSPSAGSSSGEASAQNRPGSRPNGSPLIAVISSMSVCPI
jgi:hypothetical protein